VGPCSAKLPVLVDGVSLCLDSIDREGWYGFVDSVEALVALGLLRSYISSSLRYKDASATPLWVAKGCNL
jgi:hypothetical protein